MIPRLVEGADAALREAEKLADCDIVLSEPSIEPSRWLDLWTV
jgi:hypothetical protein